MTSLPIQRHKPLYEGNGMCLCVFDILRQRPIFLFRKCPTGGEATRHYTPDDTHYNLLLTLRGKATWGHSQPAGFLPYPLLSSDKSEVTGAHIRISPVPWSCGPGPAGVKYMRPHTEAIIYCPVAWMNMGNYSLPHAHSPEVLGMLLNELCLLLCKKNTANGWPGNMAFSGIF